MIQSLLFNRDQLFWLEDINPEYFVYVQIQPWGEGIFLDESTVTRKPVALHELESFKHFHFEKNIWRSWTVYKDAQMEKEIGPVPLILDIDDESEPADLKKAYNLTKACLDLIEFESTLVEQPDQLRVIFSGRKGFHIEIKPSLPIDAQEFRQHLLAALRQHLFQGQHDVCHNVFYESTVLDTLSHQWVRLTGTMNSWSLQDGTIHSTKVIPMSSKAFRAIHMEDILALARHVN